MLRRRMMMESGKVNLISFTIDYIQYQAQEGMTWGEWVRSQYNTQGYYIDSDYSIAHPNGLWLSTGEYYVFSSYVIQEGYSYFLLS